MSTSAQTTDLCCGSYTNYVLWCFKNLSPLTDLTHAAEEYRRSDAFRDIYLESLQLNDRHNVMEYITTTLIRFFDGVIDGSLSLDIAFMQMVMVMDYTNYPKQSVHCDHICMGNQVVHRPQRKKQKIGLRQVLKDNLLNHLKVLLHFMLVSVFGKSANEMIIDKNCTNNKLYEYFIREYLPKLRNNHIRFKYCGTKTHAIRQEINRHTNHEDIAMLIANYTYVYFEEYFETISNFLDILSENIINAHFESALTSLRRRYVIGRTNTFPLLFGCMLSDKFIAYNTNHQSFLFAIHEMVFKYSKNSWIICEFLSHHSRYTFWNNAAHLIQWIENIFDGDADAIVRFMSSIIQKQQSTVLCLKLFEIPYFSVESFDICVYGRERAAVVIDYDTFIDHLYVKGNIDVIFERLIDKYLNGYDDITMEISLYLMQSLLESIRFMIKYATLYRRAFPLKAKQRNVHQSIDKAFAYLMSRFVSVERFDWHHSNKSLNIPLELCVRDLSEFDTAKAAQLKCKCANIFNILRTKEENYKGIDLLLQAVEAVDNNHSERMPLYEPQRKRRRIH